MSDEQCFVASARRKHRVVMGYLSQAWSLRGPIISAVAILVFLPFALSEQRVSAYILVIMYLSDIIKGSRCFFHPWAGLSFLSDISSCFPNIPLLSSCPQHF